MSYSRRDSSDDFSAAALGVFGRVPHDVLASRVVEIDPRAVPAPAIP